MTEKGMIDNVIQRTFDSYNIYISFVSQLLKWRFYERKPWVENLRQWKSWRPLGSLEKEIHWKRKSRQDSFKVNKLPAAFLAATFEYTIISFLLFL